MKLNVESAGWFVKPEMMGHIWTKKTVLAVKAIVEKYAPECDVEAFRLAKYCLPLHSDDWHAWNMITKKSLSILRYVLRRIHKESPLALLSYVNWTQGCLKDELTWYLEMASYNSDYRSDYFNDYKRSYMSLGMSEEDCKGRFTRYHEERLANRNVPA